MTDASSAVDIWNTVGTYLNTLVTAGLAVAIYKVTKRDEVGRLKAVLDSERETRKEERAFAYRSSITDDAIRELERIPHVATEALVNWKNGDMEDALASGRTLLDIEQELLKQSLKLYGTPQLQQDVTAVAQAGRTAGVRLGEAIRSDDTPMPSWNESYDEFHHSLFAGAMMVRQEILRYVETGKDASVSVAQLALAQDPGKPIYPSLGQ